MRRMNGGTPRFGAGLALALLATALLAGRIGGHRPRGACLGEGRKRRWGGGGLVRRPLPRKGRARARGAGGARRVLGGDARRPAAAARRPRGRRARLPRRRAALASLRDV